MLLETNSNPESNHFRVCGLFYLIIVWKKLHDNNLETLQLCSDSQQTRFLFLIRSQRQTACSVTRTLLDHLRVTRTLLTCLRVAKVTTKVLLNSTATLLLKRSQAALKRVSTRFYFWLFLVHVYCFSLCWLHNISHFPNKYLLISSIFVPLGHKLVLAKHLKGWLSSKNAPEREGSRSFSGEVKLILFKLHIWTLLLYQT